MQGIKVDFDDKHFEKLFQKMLINIILSNNANISIVKKLTEKTKILTKQFLGSQKVSGTYDKE